MREPAGRYGGDRNSPLDRSGIDLETAKVFLIASGPEIGGWSGSTMTAANVRSAVPLDGFPKEDRSPCCLPVDEISMHEDGGIGGGSASFVRGGLVIPGQSTLDDLNRGLAGRGVSMRKSL